MSAPHDPDFVPTFALTLTPAQRMALIHLIHGAMTGPCVMDVYVDVVHQTEVRPSDLLALVLHATPLS